MRNHHSEPKQTRRIKKKARASAANDNTLAPQELVLGSKDALAEGLGQEYVKAATSGQDSTLEDMNAVTSEELGGPYLVTPASTEFADGTDKTNPTESEPAALPTAMPTKE